MPSYFEEPTAGFKQYRATFAGDNGVVEYGIFSFSGAGASVEVPTHLGKIVAAIITPTESHSAHERLYCDLTITDGAVTVGRSGSTSGLTFSYKLLGHA